MNTQQIATMLAQLKDLSEMMVELSYSSLLYGSEDVAEFVLEMSSSMEILHTDFEMAVLELGDRHPVKGLLGLIRLGEAAMGFAEAATMMANIVKKGVRAHPIVQVALERAEETILSSTITKDSAISGKMLSEIGLEDDIGMRIIAVKRNNDWTFNPSDSFTLHPKDLIIARGYAEGKERLLTLANPRHRH